MISKKVSKCVLTGAVILLSGCASHDPETGERNDPLEGFNRTMFAFNYDVLDPYVLRPVAVAWKEYVPEPARNGTNNFLYNLGEPASMVNNFLQGNFYDGAKNFNRFMLNTIFGMAGLIDVAGMANDKLKRPDPQRFGTTLGSYGVPYGPYLVLPFYGSFTLRQEGGSYADTLYPVLSTVSTGWWLAGTSVVGAVDSRSRLLDKDSLLKSSADPYITFREAYFQRFDFLAGGSEAENIKQNPNAAAIADELDSIDSQ